MAAARIAVPGVSIPANPVAGVAPVKKPGVTPSCPEATEGVAAGPTLAGVSSQRLRGFLGIAAAMPSDGVSPCQAGVAPISPLTKGNKKYMCKINPEINNKY